MTCPHPNGRCSRGKCCAAARAAEREKTHGPTEDKIHRRFVAELRRSFGRRGYAAGEEPMFHTPNESNVPARYRAKLKALGVSPGVPDLIIVHPLVIEGTLYPGAALELKSERGRVSAAQLRWLGYWSAAGFWSGVLRGVEECGTWGQAAGLFDAEQSLRFTA